MTALLASILLACIPTPLDEDGGGYALDPEPEAVEEIPEPDEPPASIRIGTFNIWWLDDAYAERNEVDYAVIAELIEYLDVDILALQEIDGDGAMELLEIHGLDERYVAEVASAGWSVRTVLLYDRQVIDLERHWELRPTAEAYRSIKLGEVRVRGSDWRFVMGSLHFASNYDPANAALRQEEAQGLYDYLQGDIIEDFGESGQRFAFAGDWNDTFESIDPDYPSLDPFLADEELVFATQNTQDYTLVGWESKIDHILLSDELAQQWTGAEDPVGGCTVFAHDEDPYFGAYEGGYRGDQNISDHRPVLIELALP